MATIRILIWHPGRHLTVAAPNEREAARIAEAMLRGLDAARRGTVAFWVETRSGGEKRRLMFYLHDLAREIEAEPRLAMLTPLDKEPDGLKGLWKLATLVGGADRLVGEAGACGAIESKASGFAPFEKPFRGKLDSGNRNPAPGYLAFELVV